ncbi:hypothetical protein K8I85_10505, partial [bacterium]|nr:hypothetical protein [bacterium]
MALRWGSVWRRASGDFDEDLAAWASVDLLQDGRKAVFGVTPILKEWIEYGAEYDGFIHRRPAPPRN